MALLNEYFTMMVDCIQREEGMLDKFIGDAIMAAFGIPVGHDDDADRAVRTAIAMITELHAWNQVRVREGKLAVEIGIGLNSDQVVSGNIGSKKRMDYTIIGDGVNLAARLESACKQYGAHILISEFTYRALARHLPHAREVDIVVVKGKTQPVSIYEVMDYLQRGQLSAPDRRHGPVPQRPAELPQAQLGRRQQCCSRKCWRSMRTTKSRCSTSTVAPTWPTTRRRTTGTAPSSWKSK